MLKTIYRKIKRRIGRWINPRGGFKIQKHVQIQRVGTDYGGWSFSPDGLDASSIIYSVGIGEDASFDIAMIEKFGVTVHAFDPTPKSIEWVKRQQFPAQFVFHEVGLAAHDGTARFYAPANPQYVSHSMVEPGDASRAMISVEVRKLSTLMKELGHGKVDVLKMDIEGAEFDVIANILEEKVPIGQILVEFHYEENTAGKQLVQKVIDALNKAEYSTIAISRNGYEFSFLKTS